ncbi:MAG: hypothetical protein AB7G47_03240 [Mycolicibacterium sp.]|uniref:hypothetical protein n=1 Tax=Mycolicibacterium sp. TaxID=2320850 RepID=UPI003D0B8B78
MSAPTLPAGAPPEVSDTPPTATGPVLAPPPVGPPIGYVGEPSRLNKAAAWVGIVAGSLFIVAVIFGTGFFLGKQVGDGARGHHHRGHELMLRPGPAMPPMGPRSPGFAGPFGPGGPVIEVPRSPGGAGGPDTPTAPGRP